jgi:hypothetical protein
MYSDNSNGISTIGEKKQLLHYFFLHLFMQLWGIWNLIIAFMPKKNSIFEIELMLDKKNDKIKILEKISLKVENS